MNLSLIYCVDFPVVYLHFPMRTVFARPYGSKNGRDSEGSRDSKGGGIGGGGGTPFLLLLQLTGVLSKLLLRFFSSLSTFVKLF